MAKISQRDLQNQLSEVRQDSRHRSAERDRESYRARPEAEDKAWEHAGAWAQP